MLPSRRRHSTAAATAPGRAPPAAASGPDRSTASYQTCCDKLLKIQVTPQTWSADCHILRQRQPCPFDLDDARRDGAGRVEENCGATSNVLGPGGPGELTIGIYILQLLGKLHHCLAVAFHIQVHRAVAVGHGDHGRVEATIPAQISALAIISPIRMDSLSQGAGQWIRGPRPAPACGCSLDHGRTIVNHESDPLRNDNSAAETQQRRSKGAGGATKLSPAALVLLVRSIQGPALFEVVTTEKVK
jgi:hypothetical protein